MLRKRLAFSVSMMGGRSELRLMISFSEIMRLSSRMAVSSRVLIVSYPLAVDGYYYCYYPDVLLSKLFYRDDIERLPGPGYWLTIYCCMP